MRIPIHLVHHPLHHRHPRRSNFMNCFKRLAIRVFGPSWKTSLAGYGQLFAVTAYQGYESLNGRDFSQHDIISLLVSAGVAVALRFAKDEGLHVPDEVAKKLQDKITDATDKTVSEVEAKFAKSSPEAAVKVIVAESSPIESEPTKTVAIVAPDPVPAAATKPLDDPSDSSKSVTGRATTFGLDYSGSRDGGDNGEGAWGAKTANKEIVGVSLPEGVMLATFGFTGTWKENGVKVGRYLHENEIQVEVSRNGKTIAADVVDAGPARTYKGKLLHNAIDLTYALSHALETNGDAVVTYQIIKGHKPMVILGWDRISGCEIARAGVA